MGDWLAAFVVIIIIHSLHIKCWEKQEKGIDGGDVLAKRGENWRKRYAKLLNASCGLWLVDALFQ